MSFMDFLKSNLNFDYSVEEYKKDSKGVKDAIRNAKMIKQENIKIDMGDGETREYKFNQNHPMFHQSEYFMKKYGEDFARYSLKFFVVQKFLHKYNHLLIQNGFLIDANGIVFEHSSFDDFLSYLLNYKLKPKEEEIPIKVFKSYLNAKK